ncbi:MAG: hypothetical protein AAFQ68_06430 [Bacteroidota bacterium]
MNESEYELPYATVDIPETFYNDLTSAPHSNCLICNRYLLAPGVMYTVEKAIRRHSEFNLTDTITEAAVCMDCMMKMQEYISDESREHLMAHYQELQPMQRAKALLEKEDHDLDHWISECAFTGKDLEDCAEYQISAVFSGNQMLLHFMPMMVSDVAAKDMAEKLSKETKDNMDRFMGEHFGLPPELVNLPLLL